MLGRLIRQASHYSVGSIFIMLASFISFPILTRTLSVGDYGALNLISSTLSLLVGISKLGLQHSIVRFYAEVRSGKRTATEPQFFSTLIFGMGAVGAFFTAGLMLADLLFSKSWWHDERISRLMFFASVLIFIRVVDSGLVNSLRALQQSGLFSIYSVCRKYLALGLVLVLIFFVMPNLDGFFIGTIVAEAIATSILLIYIALKFRVSTSKFSLSLFKAMVVFGVPMLGFELSGIVLNIGDRYVIQAKLGAEPLGVYSAAYNLCEYVQAIVVASISQAITPIYVRLWEEHGADETRRFMEKTLRYYLMLACGVLAGMIAVGPQIISTLATEKFEAGAVIIPFVMGGMLIEGGLPIFASGLYLHKQTRLIMLIFMGAAILNIALNFILIPYMGITGAAIATLISYVSIVFVAKSLAAKTFRVRFPILDALKFILLAGVMYALVMQIELKASLVGLAVRVSVGIVIYGLLVLLFDKPSREIIKKLRLQWVKRT